MNVRMLVLLALIIAVGLALAFVLRAGSEGDVTKLTASDAQRDSEFGRGVAMSGDTLIVGAPSDDAEAVFADYGAAYVFQRDPDGDQWREVKKLTASDGEAFDRSGYSVAVSGDTAVVGQRLVDPDGSKAGTAYVFQRNEGGAENWGEVAKLTASDADPIAWPRIDLSDWFGGNVAISGDTAVVSAELEDAGGSFSTGAVYVFGRDEGGANNWGQVKKLTASDAKPGDRFGFSVAVRDDTAVVGARIAQDAAGRQSAGAAYVFERDEGGADNWGEVKKLTASGAGSYDDFGISVAVNGDAIVVGAYLEDGAASSTGAAYVFRRGEGGADNWGEVRKLVASDTEKSDKFGVSVAINGDTAIVGALEEDAEGKDTGAAYVFQRDQGGADNWGEVAKLTASDAEAGDWFGPSVAVSGPTVVVGAYQEDSEGDNAGAVYVFDLEAGSSGGNTATAAVIAAAGVVAGVVALGGAAWYARRRRAR